MKSKRSYKKSLFWILGGVFLLAVAGIIYITININQVLTNALNNGFKNNIISDVYELKFENLNVNILAGNVKVFNVKMYPREHPLQSYPYINSSFQLQAKKMNLKNVNLIKLILSNRLELKKIEWVEPGIEFQIADSTQVFFPFRPVLSDTTSKESKKSLESYYLQEFSMKDAFFHVINTAKEREFHIQKINLSLREIFIERKPEKDLISYKHFDFSIGDLASKLKGKNFRYVNFKDFKVNIDSLSVEETPDTLIYHFADANAGIKNLDLQTADSIYHITMESFSISYREKSIALHQLSFRPNISDAAMQKRSPYRKEHFAADIGSLELNGVNFDSLIYKRKLLIDDIVLDQISAAIYKDLTKPFPPNHHPLYLGQQFQSISMPLMIRHIKASHVNLVNTEVLPDSVTIGKSNINKATLEINNLTSMPSAEPLTIQAEAYIENSVRVDLTMKFNYDQPLFTFAAKLNRFDLTDLNALTNSYTPARISKGIADEINVYGTVNETQSNGTMKFLYHDLVIDINIKDKAKWKSTILGFAANTLLLSANPASPDLPAREVNFEVIRDPRKGYLNMMIKSILDGLKETFMMDKKNKKAYKQDKAEARKKAKGKGDR